MPKKVGESIRQLPVDPKQDVSATDLAILRDMFQAKPTSSSKVKIKEVKEDDSDSDSDTDNEKDNDSDTEEHFVTSKHHNHHHAPSVWSELKSTFLASLLFVLLNSTVVDNAIKNTGIDGIKILFVKLFIFAILFFILRYKLL
jgi:hypothetical protein